MVHGRGRRVAHHTGSNPRHVPRPRLSYAAGWCNTIPGATQSYMLSCSEDGTGGTAQFCQSADCSDGCIAIPWQNGQCLGPESSPSGAEGSMQLTCTKNKAGDLPAPFTGGGGAAGTTPTATPSRTPTRAASRNPASGGGVAANGALTFVVTLASAALVAVATAALFL